MQKSSIRALSCAHIFSKPRSKRQRSSVWPFGSYQEINSLAIPSKQSFRWSSRSPHLTYEHNPVSLGRLSLLLSQPYSPYPNVNGLFTPYDLQSTFRCQPPPPERQNQFIAAQDQILHRLLVPSSRSADVKGRAPCSLPLLLKF